MPLSAFLSRQQHINIGQMNRVEKETKKNKQARKDLFY
jgi:hypothetical protein